MALIGEWFRRAEYLLRRGRFDEELRREMEAHRAEMQDPAAFGNTLRLREEAGDAWGWRWLEDLVQDARLGLRTLRQSPGFTAAAVLTLALGIGVNLGMFRLVDALLLRPLYERPGDVVTVHSRAASPPGGYRRLSYPNYRDLRDGTSDIFASLAAVRVMFVGVDNGEGSRRTLASSVTADYFQIFDVPLTLGRAFTADDERPGSGSRVAIVSYRLWEQRGAGPNVLGDSVLINGEQFTIVGVAPKGFTGPSIPGPEIWLPLGADRALSAPRGSKGSLFTSRDAHELDVIARRRDGTSAQGAATALATVSRRLELAYPDVNTGHTFELTAPARLMFMPGPGGGGGMMAAIALALMVMPAIVLLVGCLNLANLLLARGQGRRQEMAIRSSLGAGRWRLTRQMLCEGLLLAVAGGAAGLLLSTWATRTVLASVGSLLPVGLSLPALDLDWRVTLATVGFSLAATLVFSAGPAWALAGRAIATDLKQRVGEGQWQRLRGVRISHALVVCQVALSLLLLATGGLFLMSALAAASADPGFRVDGALVVQVNSGLATYSQPQSRAVHRALVDRLRQVPGVESVTIGSDLPFSSMADSRLVVPAGASADAPRVDAVFNAVGRDYARTLGLPMIGGRDFSEAELEPGSSEPVAIVDDVLARRLWPGEDALGRVIVFGDARGTEAGRSMRIIGIVPTVKHSLGNPHPSAHVYVPLGQYTGRAMSLQLRLADASAERSMLATVARVIRDVDARLPVLALRTWRDQLDAGLENAIYRTGAKVFAAFAGIALLLAVIGVYGVKSYVVSRRTREFGIRIATGASPRALVWQVLSEGSRITAIGVGAGVLLALGAGQVLQGFLHGVNAVEPLVLVASPLVLLAASLAASFIPALRATRVDPIVALRSE
jgi:predicted permease